MLVEGIDDEDSKRPVAPETFPPPASPRGATAPLGSPARFRAPDGDGNMMTMLEASFWDQLCKGMVLPMDSSTCTFGSTRP